MGQAVFEQDITEALAFGFGSFRFEDFAVFVAVAEGIEQFEAVFFDLVFGGVAHSKAFKACISLSKVLQAKLTSTGESPTISKEYL